MLKKKLALLILSICAVLICGCISTVQPSDGTEPPISADSPAFTDAPLPPAITAPPDTVPPPPIIEAPASGDGVWTVSSEEELLSVSFEEYASVPCICITKPFEMHRIWTADRPITLYYLCDTVIPQPEGTGILLRTDMQGEIAILSKCPDLLSCGLLTIDAPQCNVSWTGELLPGPEDVRLYCNAMTFNSEEFNGFGGGGTARLSNVELLGTDGKAIDCKCSIRGNTVHLTYPLIAGESVITNARLLITSDGTAPDRTYDLREPNTLTVTDKNGAKRTYLLTAERASSNIPVVEIYTDGNAPILSKLDYVNAVAYIDGKEYEMQIKGRGNASWNTFPKKAYRLKLDKGAPLFGLEKNRDWVLVSNYPDKTLIRNAVGSDIASVLDGLQFTPTHVSVNLYLNGEYMGVYGFAEKIEEGDGRISFKPTERDELSSFGSVLGIYDIGFLCEVGWDFEAENIYNKDFFDAQKVTRIYVKEPKIDTFYQLELVYAREYIFAAENAIIHKWNWQDLIDIDSWVDWFIATELTFNTEGVFYRSTYMWKPEGGKLKLGPLWDLDMAFGNHWGDIPGYDGWCTTEFTYIHIEENWMNYLLQYPEFTDAVKARWNEKKDELLAVALASVDKHAAELEGSWQQNFEKWDIMDEFVGAASVNPYYYDTYEKQVQYLRDFIKNRWSYMDKRISEDNWFVEEEEGEDAESSEATTEAITEAVTE